MSKNSRFQIRLKQILANQLFGIYVSVHLERQYFVLFVNMARRSAIFSSILTLNNGRILHFSSLRPETLLIYILKRTSMETLSDHVMFSDFLQLAWAPGKGMKDKDWKDFWEVQDGVSYIPYDRLSKEIDYDYLEDGGVFDEDTVPLWLKGENSKLERSLLT
jgi:hypothetical protein